MDRDRSSRHSRSRSPSRDQHHHHSSRDREHKHRSHHQRDDDERRRDGRDHHRRRRDSPDEYREPVRDRSIDPGDYHYASKKRKEQNRDENDEDLERKRAKVTDGHIEEKKERRRFEGRDVDSDDVGWSSGEYYTEKKVKEEGLSDGEDNRRSKKKERRFSDSVKEESKDSVKRDVKVKEEDENLRNGKLENGDLGRFGLEKGGSASKVAQAEPLNVACKTSSVSHYPVLTKVSSITTTNENEGVNITRSDEVTGKFSTDGQPPSGAGKNGNLSLDALAKAKKALQMQKELAEKLKKIPVLNKPSSTGSQKNSQATVEKDGAKAPSAQAEASVSSPRVLPVGPPASQKPPATGGVGVLPTLTPTNYEAVKRAQELAAKMGFRQDPEFAPLINMFPGPTSGDTVVPQRPAKAPVLRLDAQGREIDEHGNPISMTKPTNLSTLKVNINKQKKEAFQILRPELDVNEMNPHFDARMGINKEKLLRPKRMSFQFVEEGKWSKQAEIVKFKNQFGDARAKELKIRQSQLAKVKGDTDINPNLIQVAERAKREKEQIPDIEWWDAPLLPSGSYSDANIGKLNMVKITIYIEHPRPIEPPAEPAPPPPQPLKLTKKEQKKLRTQRRLAKERDRQEMIRQGLIEPPKPKIKLNNLMKVLGAEATQDPTRLEMEIRTATAEREQAHVDRNVARKLTPAERREKKERKLFDDQNSLETIVSVYKVRNLKHKQTRFKVDVNAQENRLTGCAVMTDSMCVVVVEGGKKSIKRYGKLMLKRINWAAAVDSEDEGDENAHSPPNQCVLVWQGSVAKPSFNRFTVQEHISDVAARKVFADARVPHYWDLAANYSGELD